MIMSKKNNDISLNFCNDFLKADPESRYVLGRNIYTKSIIDNISIHGVIDDFTNETSYFGVPVVKVISLSKDPLVVNASGGRPLTAKARLDKLGIRNLDYFSFYRNSGLNLRDIVFNEGFAQDYINNLSEYEWIYSRLADQTSRYILNKLVEFRNTLDITHLEGFFSNEQSQYFEDFLDLGENNETFIDIGCFNGFNSLEFARLSPGYKSIFAFEPDPANFQKCLASLNHLRDVHLYQIGLSNTCGKLRLKPGESGSTISLDGAVEITVNYLDNLSIPNPTFIKMDIEGEEVRALLGAKSTIARHHPKLAISVYHNVGDFYRIPRIILKIQDKYDVYIRHYTESIYETVMFFIPKKIK